MLYVVLAVLCSVLLGFIFKLFPRFGVDTFQAIVFNYITCVLCGWVHIGEFPAHPGVGTFLWQPYAMMLGLVFVSGFNLAAQTVRHFGVTVSQIMQRMSILMTVPFAVLLYQESAGILKIMGILAAIGAIILSNWPKKNAAAQLPADGVVKKAWLWAIPFFTWLLAAVIEVTFLFLEKESYIQPGDVRFICTVFFTAGLIGMTVAGTGWIRGTMQFSWRNVLAGIILGIPNYGSMLFLLLALSSGMEGSFVFPVTNVAIILLTTIGAVSVFKERLSTINWAGVLLSVLAITLISMKL